MRAVASGNHRRLTPSKRVAIAARGTEPKISFSGAHFIGNSRGVASDPVANAFALDSTRTVELPEDRCRAVERQFAHRLGTLDDLIVELPNQLLRDDALTMDKNEQHIIAERLKDLGYI